MFRVTPRLRFIEPQLASPVDQPPEGKHWIHDRRSRTITSIAWREIAAVERMDEASTVAKIDDCSGWASDRYRSRTTSAMATPLAELILASYSCARRVRGSCP